ncbi:MAG: hypothetical protein QXK96_02360, partial [Candidatus Bathyarchaeia archaeon]
YGFDSVELSEGRSWLRKRLDDRCVFMVFGGGRWLCGLQKEKPYACKMWPFRVADRPLYGRGLRAMYENEEWAGYVYVDPRCPQVSYGDPTLYFKERVVREFVQLALGKVEEQNYSTASLQVSRLHHDLSHPLLLEKEDPNLGTHLFGWNPRLGGCILERFYARGCIVSLRPNLRLSNF